MKTFYRYLRALKFNDSRMELETLPHGGICLRFQESEDGNLWFTYARCSPTELFSKSVARRIADHRAAHLADSTIESLNASPLHGPLIFTEETDVLIEMVIVFSLAFAQLGVEAPIIGYLSQELNALAKALQHLAASNIREMRKADIWKAGIAAANFKGGYESLSR